MSEDMKLNEKHNVKCERCGKEYEEIFWNIISAQDQPEMRERIMNGSLYNSECPCCGKINIRPYEFLYTDWDKGFTVTLENEGKLILNGLMLEEIMRLGGDKMDLKPAEQLNIGSADYPDLVSKITALENGLDYIAITSYRNSIFHYFRINKKHKRAEIYGVTFIKAEDDLFFICSYEQSNGKHFNEIVAFDNKEYKREYKRTEKIRQYAFKFCVDTEQVERCLSYYPKEFKAALGRSIQFAIITDYAGNIDCCRIPDFNRDMFKDGEDVIMLEGDNSGLFDGKIIKTFTMNEYEFPFDFSAIPVILRHALDTKALLGCYEETAAESYFKELIFDCKKSDFDVIAPYEIKKDTVFYVKCPSAAGEDDGSPDFTDLFNLPSESADDLRGRKAEIEEDASDGNLYITLYVNKGKAKSGEKYYAVKYGDITELVFNDPCYFDGISFINGKKRFYMDQQKIIKSKYAFILLDDERMAEFLKTLTDAEIGFIGEDTYRIYRLKYIDGISKNRDIGEKLGLKSGYVSKCLEDGILKISEIALANR